MKKFYSVLFLVVLFFLLTPHKVFAQVVINEFSSGTSSDWIELYNTSTEAINLSSYKLMDSTTNDKVLSGDISAGGFISFSFSNWLNNDGDTVRLFNGDDLIDSISYGGEGQVCTSGDGESIGRYPDGNNTIDRFLISTRDSSNNGATLKPCPTPTPEPTPTNEPNSCNGTCGSNANCQSPLVCYEGYCRNNDCKSVTDCNCSTVTPTPTPTVAPTSSPTSKPTSTPEEENEPNLISTAEGDVLGLRENLEEKETPTPEPEEGSHKFNFLSLVFMVLGFIFIAFAGFSLLKRMKKDYNKEGETIT